MSAHRQGVVAGSAAYLLWGVFPLYFPLLHPADPFEVLAHRVVWSLLVMIILVRVTRRWSGVRAVLADHARLWRLSAAASFLAVNWAVYIYGVTSGHVVEAALGYFINPLITVLLGVLVLHERLRPVQWAALGVAGVAVLVLSVQNGRPPWIALTLAVSFGIYGLLKKTAQVGAVEGLAVETGVLAPLAAAYLLWLELSGGSTFTGHGVGHAALLMSTGIATAIPLLMFGAAAARIPLSTLGVLQYLAPTLQFAIGVLVLGEALGLIKLLGFCLVWVALCAFTADLVAGSRRSALPVSEPV